MCYIIGTAGATLAARIAEDPSVTVALLEAGDASVEDNLFAFIPGADVLGVGSDPRRVFCKPPSNPCLKLWFQ